MQNAPKCMPVAPPENGGRLGPGAAKYRGGKGLLECLGMPRQSGRGRNEGVGMKVNFWLRWAAVVWLAVGAWAPRLHAEEAAAKPMERLRWMIGTWEGEEGTGEDKVTVRMKCWLAPSGSAILYHVDVIHGSTVTPRYDGMYYWIAAQKTFVIRQVAITGGAVEGEFHLDGARATQEETVFNPDGTKSAIKIEYQIAAEKFHMKAQFRQAEASAWIPALDMDYRKVE